MEVVRLVSKTGQQIMMAEEGKAYGCTEWTTIYATHIARGREARTTTHKCHPQMFSNALSTSRMLITILVCNLRRRLLMDFHGKQLRSSRLELPRADLALKQRIHLTISPIFGFR